APPPSTGRYPAGRTRSVPATSAASTSRCSRSRSRAGRLALLVLAALAAAPSRPAGALDIKLWPFFRYARNDERGELRWSALGPLVEYVRTPELRDLRIRPLLWLTRRVGSDPDERIEILTPILSARRHGDAEPLRFLLISAPRPPRRPHRPQGPSSFPCFPFDSYRSAPVTGPPRVVLPFCPCLSCLFACKRVRTLLFPACLELDEPRVERRFYGFPFVSTVG